ncbi:MATE family efflux transporter [Spirochaeta cellobiosiphila]|uniref:MATE family efflux transporter n=1 Tax=Spirochaeta cellobiosiphila TaxID=504483 RepID=UPI0012EC36CD|nr:MATE family efflux transporter [Spirochaeta cellobiosiphila]
MNSKIPILKTLIALATPIMLQSFLQNSLSFFDTLMISQLGDEKVAAVGIAVQLIFIFNMIQFGLQTGLSINTSQYYGKGDYNSIKKILGIQILFSVVSLALLWIAIFVLPDHILSLYTDDIRIKDTAKSYLQINGASLLFAILINSYTLNLRSTNVVNLPTIASGISVFINLGLNYVFIFGWGAIPAQGANGAALATAIARFANLAILLFFTYKFKYIAAASIKEMINFDSEFIKKTFKVTWPVVLNESIWVLGVSLYSWVYARMGTQSLAAVNICTSIENVLYTPFFGMFAAGSVLIGNQIGRGDTSQAKESAKLIIIMHTLLAIFTGIILIALRVPIMRIYNVSETTMYYCSRILIIIGITMGLKMLDYTFTVSIFRGGGDTKFSLFLDFSGVWLIGVPISLIAGMIFKIPVYWLVGLVKIEHFYKILLAWVRYKKDKWIRKVI